MSMSIEEAQGIQDLRVRMYQNIQEGKPAHDGLTIEQYQKCLDAIRGKRAALSEAAAAKKPRGKKAAAAPTQTPSAVLDKYKKYNLD